MIAFADLAGFTGSVVSLVVWWPQALLVWQSRSDPHRLRGVSVTTQVLLFLNAVLWGAYAVATQSLWVGAPGLVNAPLALLTIAVTRRSRGRTASLGDERHLVPRPRVDVAHRSTD